MARRIKQAKIRFLSLVPRGANKIATIYKADAGTPDTGTFSIDMLVKGFNNDRGELTAVVYAPENRDSQGDIASAEVIKDMLYEAAKAGFAIDLKHNEVAVSRDQAFVAESFIIQKGDPRFSDTKDYDGNKVDVTGAWGVVIKIESADLRAQYRDGKWSGVSMGGTALVEQEKSQKEDTMTPAELEAALAKSNAALTLALAASLGDVLTKALKPADAPKPDADAIAKAEKDKKIKARKAMLLKGGDPRNVKRAGLVIQKETLVDELDVDDAEAFAKAQEDIADIDAEILKIDEEIKAEKDGAGDPNAKEIDRLQKQINSLRGRSNQPVSKGKDTQTKGGTFIGIEKEDGEEEGGVIGSRMANAMNQQRGYAAAS